MTGDVPDGGVIKTDASPFCKLRGADFAAVRWTQGFWADRFRRACQVTLPHLWKLAADPEWGHAYTNLRIAAGLEEGEFAGTDWQDAWVYKWVEAASVVSRMTGDEVLLAKMDEITEVIAAAQEPDGYIATQITLTGRQRFQIPRHHELYVMGHLLTAATIHYRLTGRTALLDVARRTAGYVYETFRKRNESLAHFPFNPSIIMGAVELYRATGERSYLDIANMFIDMRGAVPGGTDQCQDRIPLREETQVIGHAVFYTYLYAGAADAYIETGDPALLDALERLWDDLVGKRLYITGGTCAIHRSIAVRGGDDYAGHDVHEAAANDYDLPNATAYNEVCGQVGSFMWNWRMLCATGKARYADLMERQLYNSIISGVGLDGASWFYTNPLRWYGREQTLHSSDLLQRGQPGTPPRRNQVCCLTNLLRTELELHGYLYSTSDSAIWVHHYGGSTFEGALPDGRRFAISQATDYPWDGTVTVTVESAPEGQFALMLRVPAWADGTGISVNGETSDASPVPGAYVGLKREWQDGDTVELRLPMDVRLMQGHPKVEQARGHVAVMRGPLVYCLESPDLPDGVRVSEVRLPRDIELTPRRDPGLLGGVVVLEGRAAAEDEDGWDSGLYRRLPREPGRELALRLIPYYAWANRGVSEMTVWLPTA